MYCLRTGPQSLAKEFSPEGHLVLAFSVSFTFSCLLGHQSYTTVLRLAGSVLFVSIYFVQ